MRIREAMHAGQQSSARKFVSRRSSSICGPRCFPSRLDPAPAHTGTATAFPGVGRGRGSGVCQPRPHLRQAACPPLRLTKSAFHGLINMLGRAAESIAPEQQTIDYNDPAPLVALKEELE